jgi:hypothetical protein
MKKLKTVVGSVLLIAGIGSSVSVTYLYQHYGRISPRTPEPSTGTVFPLAIHGIVVFLDRYEDNLLEGLRLFTPIALACGAVLIWDKWPKR